MIHRRNFLLALPGAGLIARAQSPSEKAMMQMARDIQRGVLMLPEYGVFDSITFSFRGRDVLLRGKASRPILKSSAENVVKKLEGVEKVDNKIDVLPLSPNDDGIRLRTYIAIYGHPILSRYNPNRGTPLFFSRIQAATGITNNPPPGNHPIKIIVENGNVTLEGIVANVGDRTIAELQANTVNGVFAVTNNLAVEEAAKFQRK
jgi:hyperosmotically inducible periplasmic protein